jgi:hypothetical protein
MSRRLVFIILVLQAASALAYDRVWSPWDIEPSLMFRVEPLSGGLTAYVYPRSGNQDGGMGLAPDYALMSLDAEWHRFRLGVTALQSYFGQGSFAPVRAGYTIIDQPRNYGGRLFGKVPEVYVQATAHWNIWNDAPPYIYAGVIEAVAAVDVYGFGASASAGLALHSSNRMSPAIANVGAYPFVSLRVRLFTLCAGF